MNVVIMMLMAFAQNTSFSIVSRSRNFDSKLYHLFAAVGSNCIWFMTLKYLAITNHMDWRLFIPYAIGAVAGSVNGQWISMKIEQWLRLTRDQHLKGKNV